MQKNNDKKGIKKFDNMSQKKYTYNNDKRIFRKIKNSKCLDEKKQISIRQTQIYIKHE